MMGLTEMQIDLTDRATKKKKHTFKVYTTLQKPGFEKLIAAWLSVGGSIGEQELLSFAQQAEPEHKFFTSAQNVDMILSPTLAKLENVEPYVSVDYLKQNNLKWRR